MTHKTNSDERAATPGGTGAAKGKTNCEKCTACTCGTQAIPFTRKDVFAAVALHGMLAMAADHKDIFRLCVENGFSTATTCYHIAARMEEVARAEIGGTR